MFQVGDRIELVNAVRGVEVGTRGVVQSINGNEIIMDLQQNDVVLPVFDTDIQLVV